MIPCSLVQHQSPRARSGDAETHIAQQHVSGANAHVDVGRFGLEKAVMLGNARRSGRSAQKHEPTGRTPSPRPGVTIVAADERAMHPSRARSVATISDRSRPWRACALAAELLRYVSTSILVQRVAW